VKIDHIALYVRELEAAEAFFVRYFGAVPGSPYHNPKTGLRTRFFSFDTGARLELMNLPELTESPGAVPQTGYTHLAFSLGSREAVDALTARLSADGYAVASPPRVTGDGYYESCVLGPEGSRLELTE